MVVASGIWYGVLFWVGMQANRSIPRLEEWLAGVNFSLLVAALLLASVIVVWWARTRGGGRPGSAPPGEKTVE